METTARKKIVQEYYSKRAKDYDRQKTRTWKSEQGFGAEVLNEVIEALAAFEDKRVLEVGVGSGRIGFPLLKRVKPCFVGLDLSKEMLQLAKAKMASHNKELNTVLGDAESLPLVDEVFDAAICISAMHYFSDSEACLTEFSRVLKENGVFVYGDLTLHELDNCGFLDALEKTLSYAHARYVKPSEMKRLLENRGFRISRMKVIPYGKSFQSLMEDKGKYFDVKPDALDECAQRATVEEKRLYSIGRSGLTLFYTLITASKESRS